MRTYPLIGDDGGMRAFEIDNMSAKRVLRVVEGMAGARIMDASDRHEICRFVLDGEVFLVAESARGNSRFQVSGEQALPSSHLAQVHRHFRDYCA